MQQPHGLYAMAKLCSLLFFAKSRLYQ